MPLVIEGVACRGIHVGNSRGREYGVDRQSHTERASGVADGEHAARLAYHRRALAAQLGGGGGVEIRHVAAGIPREAATAQRERTPDVEVAHRCGVASGEVDPAEKRRPHGSLHPAVETPPHRGVEHHGTASARGIGPHYVDDGELLPLQPSAPAVGYRLRRRDRGC